MGKSKVSVGEFYRLSCETQKEFSSRIHDETRPLVLRRAVKRMCEGLLSGMGKDELLGLLRAFLDDAYKPSWFTLSWQKTQQVEDDLKRFERFMDWLGDASILDANVKIRVETAGHEVLSRADLIVRFATGALGAFVIHFREADKSPGGKSVHTTVKSDLYLLAAKAALEERYPGIVTSLIYLSNSDDATNRIGTFLVAQTKRSNVFSDPFGEYYEDGCFHRDAMLSEIERVLAVKPLPNCFICPYQRLCKAETEKAMTRIRCKKPLETSYAVPEFTASQMKVVTHMEGPMRVVAGPGSGKTATLVGRIRHLIEEGIPAEYILAITFTREAAGELKMRCKAFCESGELPEISTIHALGFKILRMNRRFVGSIDLLTKPDAMRIIEAIISHMEEPMKGLNYAKLRGKGGLYDTCFKLLESMKLQGREKFMKANKELDEDFLKFADLYFGVVRARGLITYDEQISLCLKLFARHPEVLDGLRRRYRYVMVDEFQDVDAAQVSFIYAIAAHGNIVVVGDDDQSIYAFRGGSNKFMLDFAEDFPQAKSVVLEENFRTKGGLVDYAQKMIRDGHTKRLEKKIRATRDKGGAPKILQATDAMTLEKAVQGCIEEGYGYGDISVLASRNATLEKMYHAVRFPCVLGKSFLIDSAYFGILTDILHLYFIGEEDAVRVHLEVVFGKEYEEINPFLDACFARLKQRVTPLDLCDYVAEYLQCENTAVTEAMEKVVDLYHIHSAEKLYEIMRYMADYADETRLTPDTSDKVLLSTAHESKGMEWPVVIVIDDFRDENTPETLRLEYVSITRPKDLLIILTEKAEGTLYTAANAA